MWDETYALGSSSSPVCCNNPRLGCKPLVAPYVVVCDDDATTLETKVTPDVPGVVVGMTYCRAVGVTVTVFVAVGVKVAVLVGVKVAVLVAEGVKVAVFVAV